MKSIFLNNLLWSTSPQDVFSSWESKPEPTLLTKGQISRWDVPSGAFWIVRIEPVSESLCVAEREIFDGDFENNRLDPAAILLKQLLFSQSLWVESTSFGRGQACLAICTLLFMSSVTLKEHLEGAPWTQRPLLNIGRHTPGGMVVRMYNAVYRSTRRSQSLLSHRGGEVHELMNTMRGSVPWWWWTLQDRPSRLYGGNGGKNLGTIVPSPLIMQMRTCTVSSSDPTPAALHHLLPSALPLATFQPRVAVFF